MEKSRLRANNLGIKGWAWAGKYQLERYLYFLHRITGLGLLLYLLLHLCVMTIFRIQGQNVYEALMALFDNPLLKAGEYIVFLGFICHAINGLRLILQELGFLLGRPIPPVYPYKDTLRKKRPLALGMIALIVILALVVLVEFATGGG